jgi:hypothetical protein
VEHRLVRRLVESSLLVRLVLFGGSDGTWGVMRGVVWARCWVLRERATLCRTVRQRLDLRRLRLVGWSYVWDWPGTITHLLGVVGCQCGLVLPVA